nr:carbohydrate esterase family 1 protein [Naematelia aurantialba]
MNGGAESDIAFEPSTSTRHKPTYLCRSEGCGKRFQRRDYRDRHEQNHVEEKPYKCETCGKGYYRKDVLIRHSTLHDPSAPARKKKRTVERGDSVESPKEAGPSVPSSLPSHTPQRSHTPGDAACLQAPSAAYDELQDDLQTLAKLISPNPDDEEWYTRESVTLIFPAAVKAPVISLQDIVTDDFVSFLKGFLASMKNPSTSAEATSMADSFLSRPYLQTCIELYFLNFDPIRPIIHRPTLQEPHNSDRNWLLLAIVLIGSTYSRKSDAYNIASSYLYPTVQSWLSAAISNAVPDVSLRLLQAAMLLNYFGAFWGTQQDHYRALLHHPTLLQHLRLAGYRHIRLESSCHLTWSEWATYEEKKRLMTFALVCDSQFAVAFGMDIHVPFRRMAICTPCADSIWRCTTQDEWITAASQGGGIVEQPPTAAIMHTLQSDKMHPTVTDIFAASMLVAGSLTAAPLKSVRHRSGEHDPHAKRKREMRGAILWSWHQAFVSSFAHIKDDKMDCELLYHLGMLHHSNIPTTLLRIGAGEIRVAQFQVKPFQYETALANLEAMSDKPPAAFSAWHAVQIYNFVLDSPVDERSFEPFAGWALYLAFLALWHFGVQKLIKPTLTPLDRLCIQRIGPTWTDIEPRLARRSALAYLAKFEPYQKVPGDYAQVPNRNHLLGLLAYTIHLLQGLHWQILEQPRIVLRGLLSSCVTDSALHG